MKRYWKLEIKVFVILIVIAIATVTSAERKPLNFNKKLFFRDISLPSESTGSINGTLAVRIYIPRPGNIRYEEGAPVLIWVPGADTTGNLHKPFIPSADDMIFITFLFPGGFDRRAGKISEGVYDHRGVNSIAALRDVILYAAGEIADKQGRKIDDVVPVYVQHENVGLLGASNGGNIVMAVAAEHGDELYGYLRYIVQWESPVSSQIATVDLGRVQLRCAHRHVIRADFVNPRYESYGQETLTVDLSDLLYDPNGHGIQVFHDGNGDGRYTTAKDPITKCKTPDLNFNGVLELDEDFPLNAYTDGTKKVYSRAVTDALSEIIPNWPSDIAVPSEADVFWNLREAVLLYEQALKNIPDLEGMILANVRDHVQSSPDKPHIHQAFDGWKGYGTWVQINPSRDYMIEIRPWFIHRTDIPDNKQNVSPEDWSDAASYCIPEDIPAGIYQLAAVHQMADRVHSKMVNGKE